MARVKRWTVCQDCPCLIPVLAGGAPRLRCDKCRLARRRSLERHRWQLQQLLLRAAAGGRAEEPEPPEPATPRQPQRPERWEPVFDHHGTLIGWSVWDGRSLFLPGA